MAKFLGETIINDLKGTPFEGYKQKDWALHYIGGYGQIDGGHHKAWALDQVARILHGTKVRVSIAKWDDGTEEYRYDLVDKPTPAYSKWVKEMKGEYDEEEDLYEYSYDDGTAP